jgi:hypothetical protein
MASLVIVVLAVGAVTAGFTAGRWCEIANAAFRAGDTNLWTVAPSMGLPMLAMGCALMAGAVALIAADERRARVPTAECTPGS